MIEIPHVEYYTRIAVGLLGFAFPLLYQVTARLDDKYSSSQTIDLFEKERIPRLYKCALIISIIFSIIWSFDFPSPYTGYYLLDVLLINSADWLVALSTIFLVVVFFIFVDKIRTFYSPKRFVKYLKRQHLANSGSDLSWFTAMNDVLRNSIKKDNEPLIVEILTFYSEEFQKKRKQSGKSEIVYPDQYYSATTYAIEELLNLGLRRNQQLEGFFASNHLFFGESEDSLISNKTYKVLWSNIHLTLRYKNESYLLSHWAAADQYYELGLQKITPVYSEAYELTNGNEIEIRDLERDKFLEFHLAICAMLLYKGQLDCLSRILKYTRSHPPKRHLVPNGMNLIFKYFYRFTNPYDRRMTFISSQYWFEDSNGMESDGIVIKELVRYLAILFLKQYKLPVLYTYDNHLAFPNIPERQSEKGIWIERIDYFKSNMAQVLKDEALLKKFNIDDISTEWCASKGVLDPNAWLDAFKAKLQESYQNTEFNQTVATTKFNHFKETSVEIIKKKLTECMSLPQGVESGEAFVRKFGGVEQILSKDVFTEESSITHLYYESLLGGHLGSTLSGNFSRSFNWVKSQEFLFERKDLFVALEKLDLENNTHVLVNCGLNLESYIQTLHVPELTKSSFKGVEIFPISRFDELNSIFILERRNLPVIRFNPPSESNIEERLLTIFDDDLQLYGSVIDFNINERIRKAYSSYHDENTLRKSVLVSLSIELNIRFNKGIRVIKFTENSPYITRGLTNSPSEIKAFRDY